MCFGLPEGKGQPNDPYYHLKNLRALYPVVTEKEDLARKFHARMAAYSGPDPVVKGYQAVSEAMMAKYVWNPYHKLRHLRAAETLFSKTVKQAPNNAELRFLRYTVEYFTPRYLKLSQHLDEDRKLVVKHLLQFPDSGLDRDSFPVVRDFMLKDGNLTPEEAASIKKK